MSDQLDQIANEINWPALSKYHGMHGFETERFLEDYQAALAQYRASKTRDQSPTIATLRASLTEREAEIEQLKSEQRWLRAQRDTAEARIANGANWPERWQELFWALPRDMRSKLRALESDTGRALRGADQPPVDLHDTLHALLMKYGLASRSESYGLFSDIVAWAAQASRQTKEAENTALREQVATLHASLIALVEQWRAQADDGMSDYGVAYSVCADQLAALSSPRSPKETP